MHSGDNDQTASVSNHVTLKECLNNLSYSFGDQCILSAYATGELVYPFDYIIRKALRDEVLRDFPGLYERVKEKYRANKNDWIDRHDKNIFNYMEIINILLSEFPTMNFSDLKGVYKKTEIKPFQSEELSKPNIIRLSDFYKIRKNTIGQAAKDLKNYFSHVHSIVQMSFPLFIAFMAIDAYFSSIHDYFVNNHGHKISSIQIVKELVSSEINDFKHTKWLVDRVYKDEKFSTIYHPNRFYINEEISFFTKILDLCMDVDKEIQRIIYLYALYEANRNAHFLDSIYNNYHHIQNIHYSPSLLLRMYFGFKNYMPFTQTLYQNSDSISYLQVYNDIYFPIVDLWKGEFVKYFNTKKYNLSENVVHYIKNELYNLFDIPCIRVYMESIPMSLSTAKVLIDEFEQEWKDVHYDIKKFRKENEMYKKKSCAERKSERDVAKEESGKYISYGYYRLLEQQTRDERKKIKARHTFFDKYNWMQKVGKDIKTYMQNHFLRFTIQDIKREHEKRIAGRGKIGCICSLFYKTADEIIKIFDDFIYALYLKENNLIEKGHYERLSLESRALVDLIIEHEDIFSNFVRLFPISMINQENLDHYGEKRFQIEDRFICNGNEKRIVSLVTHSPHELIKIFRGFCGLSFGKDALALLVDSSNNGYNCLKEFKSCCSGVDRVTCEKHFMSIIEKYDYNADNDLSNFPLE